MKRLLGILSILMFYAGISHAGVSGYGNVTVSSTTATIIGSPNGSARNIVFFNNGSTTTFCGADASVTVSNGIPIGPGVGYQTKTDQINSNVYCLTAPTFNDDVRYWWWIE